MAQNMSEQERINQQYLADTQARLVGQVRLERQVYHSSVNELAHLGDGLVAVVKRRPMNWKQAAEVTGIEIGKVGIAGSYSIDFSALPALRDLLNAICPLTLQELEPMVAKCTAERITE